MPSALRIALIWHDEVMSDVVLEKPRAITLGSAGRTTFTVPNIGLPDKFAIVRPGNRGYLLTLGERMTGTICIDGEEKDVTTVWLTIHQRTLQYETYVLPAPEENHARFYEHLLRRNLGFNGAAFVIGDEDAVFLQGQLPYDAVTDDELDRILGSFYAYVEQCFRPAMRIGFASRFNA